MDELRRALQALDEPAFCEGTVRIAERLAIMLPDGDLAAADEPKFIEWLLEHGEPAPFGQGGETKHDPKVRHAVRLQARGEARIGGFDPSEVLDAIEQAMSPRTHLDATLTDVIVYPPGGHFAPHKDTPSSPALIGTLIVGLPFAHRGGAFRIEEATPYVVDWGLPVAPDILRWVAVFSDVDHAIEEVHLGHRVTLVYSLFESDRPRVDPDRARRLAAVEAAASRLQWPQPGPLMIACTRHVIGVDGPQPQSVETLRGADREVAEALVEAGFRVAVRTCLAVREYEEEPGPPVAFVPDPAMLELARLSRPLLASEVAALLECIAFDEVVVYASDSYGEHEISALGPWLVDRARTERWLFRARAAATFVRAVAFAVDGFIGNSAADTYLYKLAALEVTRDSVRA